MKFSPKSKNMMWYLFSLVLSVAITFALTRSYCNYKNRKEAISRIITNYDFYQLFFSAINYKKKQIVFLQKFKNYQLRLLAGDLNITLKNKDAPDALRIFKYIAPNKVSIVKPKKFPPNTRFLKLYGGVNENLGKNSSLEDKPLTEPVLNNHD